MSKLEQIQYIVDVCTQQFRKVLTEMSEDLQRKDLALNPCSDPAKLQSRADTAFAYYREHLKSIGVWLSESKEDTNFTYHVTSLNLQYIAATLSHITKQSIEKMLQFGNELHQDNALKEHIASRVGQTDKNGTMDTEARYGRRVAWYILLRALKPSVVVETGIDKGLGSLVITSALKRNTEDGFPGYYYGTDINPEAGILFDGPYKEFGEILYGDSVESLQEFSRPISIFINDSDHSASYEQKEYEIVSNLLLPQSIIVSDNAHGTTKLLDFARQTGREFLFIPEVPENHWYPGAGVGIAFR